MTTCRISIAISMLLAANAFAGWKDTGAPQHSPAEPAPSARPTAADKFRPVDGTDYRPAPRPQERHAAQAPASGRPTSGATVMTISPDMYSTFLDARTETDQLYRLRVASGGKVEVTNMDFSFIDLDTRFALGDFRNVCYGDLSIDVAPSLRFITDDADIGHMPSTFAALPIDIEWIWRYLNGWSFELGFTPGVYSAASSILSGSSFGFPFRGCFYYSFSETTSVRAGLELRPGWDQLVMPLVGIAWQPTEMFRAELGLPQSFANLQIGRLGLFGELKWRNVTYGMNEKTESYRLEDVSFNDWLLGAGASFDFTDSCRIAVEFGVLTSREIQFNEGSPIDVDSSSFFGITLGSEF